MDLQRFLSARDVTHDQLAERTTLSPDRIRAIEAGSPATLRELTRIADALAVDEFALVGREPAADLDSWSAGRMRSNAGAATLTALDARNLARLRQLVSHVSVLAEELSIGAAAVARARAVTALTNEREHDQGYALARTARSNLGFAPTGPIVDLSAKLADWGVAVVDMHLGDTAIEAISFVEPNLLPTVVVNASNPKARRATLRRAILAHELCHVLHDTGQDARLFRATKADGLHDAIEMRAEAFGAEFLAPAADVQVLAEHLGDTAFVERVASRYGLSIESAYWRAYVARRVPGEDAARKRILNRLAGVDASGDFPSDAPPTTDSMAQGLLARIIDQAQANLRITSPRADELRGWC